MIAELETGSLNLDSYRKYMTKVGDEISAVQKFVPVIVGEWSLFNSLATGSDTKGGINPVQETFEKSLRMMKMKWLALIGNYGNFKCNSGHELTDTFFGVTR